MSSRLSTGKAWDCRLKVPGDFSRGPDGAGTNLLASESSAFSANGQSILLCLLSEHRVSGCLDVLGRSLAQGTLPSLC